jgi:Ca2+-transporting ATPase
MICARKIHDEWNIFEGIHTTIIFIVLWFIICGGQVIITQFGTYVFICCLDGLDGTQWGMAIGVGLTSFIINLFLMLIPDFFCPKLGLDSVDDRRAAE